MSDQHRLTVGDLDNLRHMLGVSGRHPRGYRNYYIAGRGDLPSMERLEAHGFVVKHAGSSLSDDACFHATEEGARAVGLERLPSRHD